LRKYLRRPKRGPLADRGFAARVQQAALVAATSLGVDWAARVDFLHERASGRLRFLECDAAPLVGPASAFAASLAAAGMARGEQLARLLGED
jgi:D-alanine-D-alanine ligase-like ATP-grasp enzyme